MIKGLFFTALASVVVGATLLYPAAIDKGVESTTGKVVYPTNGTELYSTTVMIVNKKETNGGSGVIYTSTESGSIILTNKHVCEVIKHGGLIKTLNYDVEVRRYKKYTHHDLCMIKVDENLKINTKVAKRAGKTFQAALQAGHPHLLPMIVERGEYAGYKVLQIATGVKKCDGTEDGEELLYCIFYGKKPVLESFDSQIVTTKVLPGSSGSAVYNANGEITNLVFAGARDGFSYAFTVPNRFLNDFIKNEASYEWSELEPEQQNASTFNIDDIFAVTVFKKAPLVPALWSKSWSY